MFKIRYRCMPINFVPSRKFWSKAYSILIPNADFLKLNLTDINSHINECAQEVLYALSLLYDFHPTTFKIRNLVDSNNNLPSHSAKKWLKILKNLDVQLKQIKSSISLDQVKKSYPNCITIDGLISSSQAATNFRERLKHLGNAKRYRFIAYFYRYGRNQSDDHKTILIKNVYCNNKMVAHHLWFNVTKQINQLGKLKRSDQLIFNARVRKYYKGAEDQYYDYHLIYPTHVHLVRDKIHINNVKIQERQPFSGTFRNFKTPRGRQVRMNKIHWNNHRILGSYLVNCANHLRKYTDLSPGDRFTFTSKIKFTNSKYIFTYPTKIHRIKKRK